MGRVKEERGRGPRARTMGAGRIFGGEGDHFLQAVVQLQLLRRGNAASAGLTLFSSTSFVNAIALLS